MKKIFTPFCIAFLFFVLSAKAQFGQSSQNDAWKKVYRSTPEKTNDLVHTKLDVSFDYNKQYLYGKAWITLKPHFYPQDSLVLDAKGMYINQVAMIKGTTNSTLTFSYADSLQLHIKLDKTYKADENYTVYIEYTARPNELKTQGGRAIRDAKGLYFINPLGKDKDSTKPTEIWTQGEVEASSVWFPTIDKPNQKTTDEINMTVLSKYVTLSNGKLTQQKTNADGTRTDTWKMDKPHSPYLFFMGVGDFAVVRDSYKGKEVSYYVEKPFESVARGIFGLTPEMIKCFSTKLGVEYPWDKYSQMVGREYVSGAMENTTATLHSEFLQQNARQLTDGNKYEEYISHELFHQWFGDLVTAESWSNITMNETFANYGELIWDEYKYGADAAGARNYRQMNQYLQSRSENKNLVRYNYRNPDDVFDRVSYEKGGRIIQMLRNYVGDEAFFKSLNTYLTRYQYQNAEAAQLRLVFEEITGKDLNWFWNQWYYSSGHPKLDIVYGYNEKDKKATIIVTQKQTDDKVFRLPVAIDMYANGSKQRYNVWVENKADTFSFPAASKPDLINFDGEKVLLAEKTENKTMQEYMYQYTNLKKYADRMEAVEAALDNKTEAGANALLAKALSDPYFGIRRAVLDEIKYADLNAEGIKIVTDIARNDEKRLNRAAAIDILAEANKPAYKDLFTKGVKDSSYSVAGSSLVALSDLDEAAAIALLPSVKNDAKGRLKSAIGEVEALTKGDDSFDEMTSKYNDLNNFRKIGEYKAYLKFLGNVNNTENFEKGIDKIVALRNLTATFQPDFKAEVNERLEKLKQKKESLKKINNNADLEVQIKYIEGKMK